MTTAVAARHGPVTGALGSSESGGPVPTTWKSWLLTYSPALLGVVVAIMVSQAVRQLLHPFIAHDDWDNLIPPDAAREAYLRDRLLWEGRWLNYLLWHLGAWILTPVTATAVYFVGYAAFVVRLAHRLASGWAGLLTAAALFVSPMVAEAMYWPAVLWPSMVILGAAAWLLPHCHRRNARLLLWLGGFTLLAMTSYQPVALLLLLLLLVEERERGLVQQAGLTVAFGLSWAASILVVFTLNWFTFGVFGVQAQYWREPHPLNGVGDLLHNLGVTLGHFASIMQTLTVPVLLGVAAVVTCLCIRGRRKHALTLIAAVVVMAGLESMTTIVAGFATPFRSSMWVWTAIIVALAELARAANRRIYPMAAGVAAVAVALSGCLYWGASVSDKQRRLASSTLSSTGLDDSTRTIQGPVSGLSEVSETGRILRSEAMWSTCAPDDRPAWREVLRLRTQDVQARQGSEHLRTPRICLPDEGNHRGQAAFEPRTGLDEVRDRGSRLPFSSALQGARCQACRSASARIPSA